MKFEKTNINRAVEEINECLNNILRTERGQYALRIRQLLRKINDNEILNYIIKPYFDLELDEENFGFIGTGHYSKCDFVIPENEDEEIALILRVLKYMAENESTIESGPFSIYMKKTYDENLFLFNQNIVEPAFKKLYRKLLYKLEDITSKEGEKVEAGDITIINVNQLTANNSMIALGKNITQQSDNVFEKIRDTINMKIENEDDKNELLQALNEMEKNKADKNKFKQCYDDFLLKIGTYMSIIGPFLPLLFDYLKK
jgi:hypothetical protein